MPTTWGKRKHTKKKKNVSHSLSEREKYDMRYQRTREAKRTDSVDAVFHHRFIQREFCYVYSSSSVRVGFLSLSFLSLSRARKKKNERGKVRTCTHTDAGARAHGENRIRSPKACFYHSRLTQRLKSFVLFIIIFEIVRVRLERTSPARALYVAFAYPSRVSFFFACPKKCETLKF